MNLKLLNGIRRIHPRLYDDLTDGDHGRCACDTAADRDREVLELLAGGELTTRQIAEALYLSTGRVVHRLKRLCAQGRLAKRIDINDRRDGTCSPYCVAWWSLTVAAKRKRA